MRLMFLTALMGMTLIQQKCDWGNPENVRLQTEQALQPYFPNVKVLVFPKDQLIIGLTCVDPVGPKFLDTLQQQIPQIPQMQQLSQLRQWGPLFGSHTYKVFVIGFEQAEVAYFVDQRTTRVIYRTDSKYVDAYHENCGGTVVPEAR